MNILSFDTAYSLYPRYTFEDYASLVLNHTTSAAPALQKYVQRGWDLVYEISRPAFDSDLEFRTPMDKRTWNLPLDCTGLVPSYPGRSDPLEISTWMLSIDSQLHATIDFVVVYDQDVLFPVVVGTETVFTMLCHLLNLSRTNFEKQRPFWPSTTTNNTPYVAYRA